MRALVTAGGTREPIDDVRVVTNLSTGRFGVAIARALADRGVEVTLLAGHGVDVADLPASVRIVGYGSTAELRARLDEHTTPPPDLLLMAAAVADYSPAPIDGKLRSDADELVIRMQRNPKLLGTLRARCPDATIVGFKLLSGVPADRLIAVARAQNDRDDLDLTWANDLAELGGGQHPGWIVPRTGDAIRVVGGRAEVADQLARHVLGAPPSPVGQPGPRLRAFLADAGLRGHVATRGADAGPLGLLDQLPVEALLSLDPAVVVADVEAPPEGVVGALAQAAWEGRWSGRSFVAADGEAALVGIADVDRFLARWDTVRAGWVRRLAELGHAAVGVRAEPIFGGGDVVGVVGRTADGSAVWIAPERRGVGDRVAERLVGERVVTDARAGDVGWWVERGWRVAERRDGLVILEPPALRTDVVEAASVCLLDPVGRRVLLGRRGGDGPWAFPGGRREPREGALDAALRELREETGIVATGPALAHTVVFASSGEGEVAYRIANVVVPALGRPEPVATSELDARWIPLAEVAALRPMTAGTRRVLRALARGPLAGAT